jgi:adenylate kinase
MQKYGRLLPNILISGTPGCGKTTLCSSLWTVLQGIGFQHVPVGNLVKRFGWYTSYDETFDSFILDEDKFLAGMKEKVKSGGALIDFHSITVFPKCWIDLVIVLRTDNTVLYDRLNERNYNHVKILENVECEIMQVLLEEAVEAFPHRYMELPSTTEEDKRTNESILLKLVQYIIKNNTRT